MYLNKILVTTDFSEAASAAFPFARKYSSACNCSLTLINIVESIHSCMELEGYIPPQALIEKAQQAARNQAQKKLQETANRYFANYNIDSFVIDTLQDISHAICKYADENNFGLILIASQGKGFVKRIFPGSVAEQVSRMSACPVLVVPGSLITSDQEQLATDPIRFRNILVTTDFSEDSKNAFNYAVYEARNNSAKLSAAYVYELFLTSNIPDLYAYNPDYCNFQKDYIASLDQKLREYVRQNIDMESVAIVLIEKIYSTAYTISEYIKNHKIDLLVISTHGCGPRIKLIGGVVEEILKLSVCPVLVVPKPGA